MRLASSSYEHKMQVRAEMFNVANELRQPKRSGSDILDF
jgi:hypothetical protein